MKLLAIAFDSTEAAGLQGFATALGLPFDLLVLQGDFSEPTTADSVAMVGLAEIPTADVLAPFLSAQASGYTHVAGISSMRSKDVLARVAGLLDCGMVTDVIEAVSPQQFKRPVVAGSIVATVEVLDSPVVLTVRPAGFKATGGGEAKTARKLDWTPGEGKAKRISQNAGGGARPDLTQAKVIVTGGRPLQDAATFEKVIGGAADRLGGAAGATRAAVDSGIASNELQVGQTGKIVAPNLYIAAGVSGSTQHMAGIKDSKCIVAINKDPDAPIFEFADFGLVADLFTAIPEFLDALNS